MAVSTFHQEHVVLLGESHEVGPLCRVERGWLLEQDVLACLDRQLGMVKVLRVRRAHIDAVDVVAGHEGFVRPHGGRELADEPCLLCTRTARRMSVDERLRFANVARGDGRDSVRDVVDVALKAQVLMWRQADVSCARKPGRVGQSRLAETNEPEMPPAPMMPQRTTNGLVLDIGLMVVSGGLVGH